MSKFLSAFALAVISVAAALWGLGLSYQAHIVPGEVYPDWQGIHSDGWVQDGASWRIHDLAPYGNRLQLKFDSWRPGGIAPAHMKVELCGEQVADFVVTESMVVTLALRGKCHPQSVEFKVVNPFVPSAHDKRRLGAKLIEASIESKLRVPVVAPSLLLTAFVMFFVMAALVFYARAPLLYRLLAYVFVAGGFLLTWNASGLSLEKVYAVWLFVTSCALGIFIASHIDLDRIKRMQMNVSEKGLGWSIAVFLVVFVAALLRLYGIDFGLPANFHPDEVPKINAIERMIAYGDLNPRYFLHPSLLLYSTYFVSFFVDWWGVYDTWRENAFLAGRLVSVISGTLSVWLVFLIGRRLFSNASGLMAALLLAVFPLHVTCSRYLKEDALLLFMVLLCISALLKAVYEDRIRFLILAGVVAGFACGVKYTGLLTFGIIGLAPWLKSRSIIPDPKFLGWGIVAGCLIPLGFLLTTPYALLDNAKFVRDFMSEHNHATRGHTTPVTPWSKYWTYHLYFSVIPGASYIVTVLSMIGVGFLLWRRRIEDLFVLAMIILFYVPAEAINSKPAPQPERYILPVLPFVALSAAEFLRLVFYWRYRILAIVVAILAVAMPLNRTVQLASEIPSDTRERMEDWMIKNLPHGSKVYLDWKRYAPSFWQNEFEITYIPRAEIIRLLEINSLKQADQDYLVLSTLFYDRYFSQIASPPAVRQLFRQLFTYVPIITEIAPKHGTYGFHNPTLTLFSLKEEDFDRLQEELRLKGEGKLQQTSNERISYFHRR